MRVLLVLLAVPGLLLLLRDLLRPGSDAVVERAARWQPHVAEASTRFGVPPDLIVAVIAAESKGERTARSSRGAVGLMQLMPATAREAADQVGIPPPEEVDLYDPRTNVLLGTYYLKRQLDAFGGDLALALAAYNAGPTRVRQWRRALPELGGAELVEQAAFPETRRYVAEVLAYRELIAAGGSDD